MYGTASFGLPILLVNINAMLNIALLNVGSLYKHSTIYNKIIKVVLTSIVRKSDVLRIHPEPAEFVKQNNPPSIFWDCSLLVSFLRIQDENLVSQQY